MSAWMQAGVLANELSRVHATMDVEWLRSWTQSRHVLPGIYASLADLRTEPMFLSTIGTTELLRAEVMGRLRLLRGRHENEGRVSPAWEVYESFIAGGQTVAVSRYPGPLEAHKQAAVTAPQNIVEDVEAGLSQDEVDGPAIANMAQASHIFVFPQSTTDLVRRAVRNFGSVFGERGMVVLASASVVAACSRDVALAEDIAQAIFQMASSTSDRAAVIDVLQVVLRAAAAHEDHDKWREFLERAFDAIAHELPGPPSDCLEVLRDHMELLSNVLPIESWCHVRAKLIAMSGVA